MFTADLHFDADLLTINSYNIVRFKNESAIKLRECHSGLKKQTGGFDYVWNGSVSQEQQYPDRL